MALGFLDVRINDRSLMEGASSIVRVLGDGWVRKTQKRSARKSGRVTVAEQLRLQSWSAAHLATGYRQLFCPAARVAPEPNSYEMELVDTTSDPFLLGALPSEYEEEVKRFRTAFERGTGARLFDVEFYVQKDGRLAVLDFDQCHKVPR